MIFSIFQVSKRNLNKYLFKVSFNDTKRSVPVFPFLKIITKLHIKKVTFGPTRVECIISKNKIGNFIFH